MKISSRTIGVVATLAVALLATVHLSWAGDPQTPPSPIALLKSIADEGKPGPEHARLQPLIGDWSFTARMWTDPNQPPAELKGTATRQWIMGGRFVQESVKGEFEGKPFEGIGLWGYDHAQKKYTTVRVCGLAGRINSVVSDYNESARKFECVIEERCPITGELTKGRDETTIVGSDKIIMNTFKTVDDKEVKVREIVFNRKV